MDEKVKKYFSEMGRRGGKASGVAKARGGTDYYRKLAKKSALARKRKVNK